MKAKASEVIYLFLLRFRATRAQGTQEGRGSPKQDRQLPQRSSDIQWRWIESSQLLVKTLGKAPRTAHTMYSRSAAYLLPKTRRSSPSASNNWQTFPRHPTFLSLDSTGETSKNFQKKREKDRKRKTERERERDCFESDLTRFFFNHYYFWISASSVGYKRTTVPYYESWEKQTNKQKRITRGRESLIVVQAFQFIQVGLLLLFFFSWVPNEWIILSSGQTVSRV